jgi:hypothetical protein
MMKKLFVVILLVWSIPCAGQSAKEQLAIANAARTGQTDFYEEVPFTDRAGYLIVPVTIGTKTYDYIFDTGGYNTITTDITTDNSLPVLMKVPVGSSNQIKTEVALSKVPLLTVGNIPFTSVGVFTFDFKDSPLIQCYTNGGLLGKGVIKEAVWQIDYREKVIRIADRVDKMPNLEKSVKIKVRLDKVFNPFVKIEVNGRAQEFMLDFGYGGFISLTEKTASAYKFMSVVETMGEGTIGANGVKEEPMYVTRLTSLNIAGLSIPDQAAFYAKSNNYNLIGSELAKYFIVTLNFKEQELLLTPIDAAVESFRSFGMDMNLNESGIYVSRLYKGFDAHNKGLLLNDRVMRVNDVVIDGTNLCDSFFAIRRVFSQTDRLTITIIRKNQEVKFELEKAGLK